MALNDRVLMGPGPCNPYPEAVEALGRPMLGHLDPTFLDILDETCDRLRAVFRTANAMTLPVSGTGSAGMEAALVNLVEPGDPVVVGVNGVFGARMCDVASRIGADVTRVDFPWGQPVDPERLLAAHSAPKVVAVVHAETSTGVRSDIAPLADGKGDALLLVDCVTSLGGIEVDVDGWGVDVAYSGTQKCLGVPPGLAPLTLSDRARDRLVERSPSWYLDLRMIGRYTGPASGPRVYHHTAPVSMIASLHAGLGALLDEGLDAAVARHAECGQRLQEGLAGLGFELFAADGHRLPELTSVVVPDGVDDAKVRTALLERYGIEIGGGLGDYAGRMWRIGCMGHTARPRNVTLLLGALAELLGRERS
ncbi:MAG TPA: alanine--glyoxylate aminotransferase family protein [Acidimicrobiales bacterium]|nr:alanine--glyoxylate aminotransferase family protein [Acidimicrobiales bacterium]